MKFMHHNRIQSSTIAAVVLSAVFFLLLAMNNQKAVDDQEASKEAFTADFSKVSCEVKDQVTDPGAEIRIVRGPSMEPRITDGSMVIITDIAEQVLKYEDIVTVRIGNGETPIIKSVKGLPGDRLAINPEENGQYMVLVNDKIVKNSENTPYTISERGSRMLSLYINDYDGAIPPNTYFLLGDISQGSQDSTQIGLIDRSDILGKVVNICVPLPKEGG